MKKSKTSNFSPLGLLAALAVILFSYLFAFVPINLHDPAFWMTMVVASAAYAGVNLLRGQRRGRIEIVGDRSKLIPFAVPAVLFALMLLIMLAGAEIFHAGAYASIINLQDAEFTEDLPEAMGTDSIALMDTASAKMLGDREIGSLANVVSQYNVSDDYTQIDYQGKPKKVAPLEYAGFFKWLNNRKEGVPGYVMVDPVSMSASYKESGAGMVYTPSAYLLENAYLHMHLHYPMTLWGNLHFEVDEEGHPYYVASVYSKKIALFNGTTVSGAIIMDPVTGKMEKYALEDVPTWVDDVYEGYLLCQQYNWYGRLQNGYLNSLFAKKGCKQITTYNADDYEDAAPTSDFGYVAKGGDIWIYTGVTSLNSDSSNVGFLLANERTGEAHYFVVAGADEKSAMAAAEGEVQEKRYQASFPSLINVKGNPTYIMVLKDNSGLVKLFAAVNVEQYNLVTTASTQSECLNKYRTMLGIVENGEDPSKVDVDKLTPENPEEETLTQDGEADITIADIKYIDIDGNTWIYLISSDRQLYKAKAKNHEEMLLLQAGDTVHLKLSGKTILEVTP